MVAAVARSGYAGTTVKQLVSLAGVSRTTFYKHFTDKEECFLATYDTIVAIATERVSRIYRTETDWRERLRAGFQCFADIVVGDLEASRLVLVDALGAGHRALEHRERATRAFELMLRQSFDSAPEPAVITDTTIRAIVAGIRRVAYQSLNTNEPEQLSEKVDDLLRWALGYYDPRTKPPVRAPTAAATGTLRLEQALKESRIPPLDPVQARASYTHRQRILHAVVSIASEGGYPALSMPAIAARAGVSNETFYQHFNDKQDAFMTACSEAVKGALKASLRTFEAAPDWPRAIQQTIGALLRYIAADPVFARLAFFEIFTAGPAAVALADRMFQDFTGMFQPGHEQYPEVPQVVSDAITGGLWNVIHYELGHNRAGSLPTLGPEMVYVALVPFLGTAQASRIARSARVRTQKTRSR